MAALGEILSGGNVADGLVAPDMVEAMDETIDLGPGARSVASADRGRGRTRIARLIASGRQRSMAAPRYVSTIARVAKMLGADEELLHEIPMVMEPEDGRLTVWDTGYVSTIAFTEFGVENLQELLADLKR